MVLTRDYKPVLASLDRSVEFQPFGEYVDYGWLHVPYKFQVGPIKYEVELSGKDGDWLVSFEASDVVGTDEELIEFFSKAYHKEVTIKDLSSIKNYIRNNRMSDLGFGDASAVFATMAAIIKDAISNHQIDCLSFSATTEKKGKLYQRLIRTLLSGWNVVLNNGHDFEVCRTYQ